MPKQILSLLLRKSPFTLLISVILSALSAAFSTLLLAVLLPAVTRERPAEGWQPLALFLALCVLVSVTRVFGRYAMEKLGQGAVFDLRMDLSRKILSSPLLQLEGLGTSRLLTVLIDDVTMVSFLIVQVPVLSTNLGLVIGCLVYLATISLPLFWMLLALLVLGGVSYQIPTIIGARRFTLLRQQQERLFEYFRGVINGTKELKIHHRRQEEFLSGLEKIADGQRRLQISANLIHGGAAAWGHLLLFVVIGALVYLRPQFGGTSEALIGFTLVLIYMMGPLQIVLNAFPQLGQAGAALRRAESLGLSLTEPLSRPGIAPEAAQSATWSKLQLDGIMHQYHSDADVKPFTLGPIDMEFGAGETIFLVGGNGSGKTTLAKVLVGLYTPEQGNLALDGTVIDDDHRQAYRENFTVVFSDFYLFDSLLGLSRRDLATEAERFLSQLQLTNVVSIKDRQLSTLDVSQGQRKRLALLTAYLEDRPIYVFDEWAADQDPFFKKVFYLQILPELKRRGKTVLVITHDDRYYACADRIIKLDYGQVTFDGPAESFSYHPPELVPEVG